MMGVLLKYLLLFSTFPGTAEFWFDGLEIWTKTASEEYADCGEGTCQCTSVQADCSDLYLHAIPDLPAGILQLDLSLNRFTAIDSDIFPDNVTGVISLDLSYNMIRYISDGAFRSLVNLTTVILRGTLLDRYERLSPVFAVPNLTYLDIKESEVLEPLPDGIFYAHPLRHLQGLSMGVNYNDHLNMSNLVPLNNLILFEVELSRYSELYSAYLPQLQLLRLDAISDYSFDTCDKNGSSFFPNLTSILITCDEFKMPSVETCFPRLLFFGAISSYLSLWPVTFDENSFPSLESVLFTSQIIVTVRALHERSFANSHLQAIHLTDNKFDFADDSVAADAFLGCPNLTRLQLRGNDFSRVTPERFLRLFGSLKMLVYLNLDSTSLSRLSVDMFANFERLEEVFLGDNKLNSVPDGTFDSLTSLTTLSLSQNSISVVRETTFSVAVRQRLTVLDLSSNPFACSCELRWFQLWLVSSRPLFELFVPAVHIALPVQLVFGFDLNINLSNMGYRDVLNVPPVYVCDNIPNTTVQSFYMPEQACLLTRQASTFVIITVLMLMSFMGLGAFLYRYRWHVRLMLYEAFRGRGDRLRHLQERRFDYDVFVSYDQDDLGWVRAQLMPALEGLMGLRLCVHERDFIPGKNILDNIADCVETSKKVLMLFSISFAKSPWCQFELNYCLSHVMDCDDELIVVFLHDIPSRDMTPAMMAVTKTTTYIEWVDEDEARDSFWRRIMLALHEVLPGV